MGKKNKQNFLDFIPKVNVKFTINQDNIAVLEKENKGFYNKIAQKFFKKPAISFITLDEYGTFIFQNINGVNTVYDISKLLDEKFGEKAYPLVERLVTYFRILKNNDFIEYKSRVE